MDLIRELSGNPIRPVDQDDIYLRYNPINNNIINFDLNAALSTSATISTLDSNLLQDDVAAIIRTTDRDGQVENRIEETAQLRARINVLENRTEEISQLRRRIEDLESIVNHLTTRINSLQQ